MYTRGAHTGAAAHTTIQAQVRPPVESQGAAPPCSSHYHAETVTDKKERQETNEKQSRFLQEPGVPYLGGPDSVGGSTGSWLTAIGLDGLASWASVVGGVFTLDGEHSDGWLVHANTRCHMREVTSTLIRERLQISVMGSIT